MSDKKEILKKILEVTDELITSIKRDDYDDVQKLLDNRQKLIEEFQSIKDQTLSMEETTLLTQIKDKKQIAKELISKAKDVVGQEIKKVASNTKAVSAYRIMKNIGPVLYSEKDM